jgi:hypothetical protein
VGGLVKGTSGKEPQNVLRNLAKPFIEPL